MPDPILFYFDFVSPYGYLGSVGVERIAAARGLTVEWRPILLGISVLKVMGLKGVADTPLKRDYVRRDLERCARLMDIDFNRGDAPLQPLTAARAFLWLNARDAALAKRFAQGVYHAQWAEARDMSSPDAVADLGAGLGLDRAELLAAIGDEGVKAGLRAQVETAIEAGVFGVPTFVVDGEMFWGADRLPMLARWLDGERW
jgi:2-hydroxychromene-2-carboxylate isomerase